MTDEATDWVVVKRASTPFEARVIKMVMEDAGIPCLVDVTARADEFAVSQALMNLQGTGVRVPADRVEDAQKALEEAKERGEALEAEGTEQASDESPSDKG